MKRNIAVIVVLFLVCSINAQDRIYLNGGYGYYLQNSENDLRIMGDKNFRGYFSFGAGYQRPSIFGLNLLIDFNYQQISKDKVLEYVVYDPSPNADNRTYGIDMQLVNYSFDLAYVSEFSKNFSVGIGPSFIITNRILDMDDVLITVGQQIANLTYYDKLASSALGANAFLMFNAPLTSDNKLFFSSKVKLRYTHSVWFDEGIRKLDNYKQEFITSEISAGIGYSF